MSNEIIKFNPGIAIPDEIIKANRFRGSRLVKMTAAQYAFYLDNLNPIPENIPMMKGDFMQKLILGNEHYIEMMGDNGDVLFTFDAVFRSKYPTLLNIPLGIQGSNNTIYIEHKAVDSAYYSFYATTLIQLLAYYGWSRKSIYLQSAHYVDWEEEFSINELADTHESLLAIICNSSGIMSFFLDMSFPANRLFALDVSEFFTRKAIALRAFLGKDDNARWIKIREWDRINEPRLRIMETEAMNSFSIKMYPNP